MYVDENHEEKTDKKFTQFSQLWYIKNYNGDRPYLRDEAVRQVAFKWVNGIENESVITTKCSKMMSIASQVHNELNSRLCQWSGKTRWMYSEECRCLQMVPMRTWSSVGTMLEIQTQKAQFQHSSIFKIQNKKMGQGHLVGRARTTTIFIF